MKQGTTITLSNSSIGTHGGNITFSAAAPIHTPYLLVSFDGTQVKIAAVGDLPFGSVTDEAEIPGDIVNVQLLGGESTAILVAAGPISIGDLLYTSADGKVNNIPIIDGTCYQVGIALGAAIGEDDIFEALTGLPTLVGEMKVVSQEHKVRQEAEVENT